ncbi:MAG TPA: acetoacetate--CoA ligase [Solirubrobacteraceae bacterium]|jgi:acetoacetyl-CoA synthetase|nr:acetoacetate--CoA ligase [Solirubrobacteraceae bacterium]
MASPEVLWQPSQERAERSTLTRYQRWLGETRGLAFNSYAELWRWSVDDLEGFWSSICEFFHVRFEVPAQRVLGRTEMPGAEWFPGAQVSYAEHVFRGKDDDEIAIRHASELREAGEWTWGELRRQTARIAAGLKEQGVGEGDRVVAYMPNIPETAAAFLACASIGATWSSAAPEFGTRSVIDRFAQIEPKILLAIDGYRYGGKDYDRREHVRDIAAEIPSLERVATLGYLEGSGWEEGFLGDAELSFAALPFDHPLWVLYSSGTTGLPKPIIHGQGGILVEHIKKMGLHLDAQPGDRVFWFTTTGWMMWNFLLGVLLTEASVVLFDGNPGYPDLNTLWDLAERTRMTCLGTSAAFIAGCMKAGVEPARGRDLSALRSVGSTGSPLAPEGFRWVYDQLGSDTWLFSTSGGTDVCTAFVGGVPTLPVYLGELQGRALGAAVQAWDAEGRALENEVGELVITEPMPSMPIGFWGDEDGSRYRESYFDTYPGVWRHGDWIMITDRGTAVIYGRSDSTINRGGVRMGTSEIYRAVLSVPEVLDALVVDVPRRDTDGWMPLFVVVREGEELSDELISEIKRRIRQDCSPRHVPDEIRRIDEVPRTLSGKVLEIPVKRILMGAPPEEAASRESLANPDALDYFVRLHENEAPAGR